MGTPSIDSYKPGTPAAKPQPVDNTAKPEAANAPAANPEKSA